MDLERKHVPFLNVKATGEGAGSVEGYASTFGNLDSYGDTILPGAYAPHLAEFARDGFIAWQHDWMTMIGTPAEIREDETGLYLKADFHTHARAQEARQITTERIARGHSMGLSIGYQALKWSFQESETTGDRVRLLEEIKLFEVSLVAVPADSFARVTAAKQRDLTTLPFSERMPLLAEWLRDLPDHARKRLDMLKDDPRGAESRALLQAIADLLPTVRGELEPLLVEPKAGVPNGEALYLEFQHAIARLNGAAV